MTDNIVRTTIKFSGEKSEDIIAMLKNSGNCNERQDEPVDFGTSIPENIPEGEFWYTWRLRNWGTKWNAVNSEITCKEDGTEVKFSTPHDIPLHVINKILLECNNLGVKVSGYFSDEAIATHCGIIDNNGIRPASSREEAISLYQKTWGT